MNQINMKYFLLSSFALLVISCNTSSNNQTVEIGGQEQAYQDSVKQATIINNNTAAKTDAEVYLETGQYAVDQFKKQTAAKRKKDSIELSTREAVWVYQIGLPQNSEEELWAAYDRVKSFDNIYAFKQSRNTYILIKKDFYTNRQQAEDSLAHFNTLLSSVGVTDLAKTYNLMSDCKVKEKVVHTDDIKVKKKQMIRCLICD